MRLINETLGSVAVTMSGGAVLTSLFGWLRAIFTREAVSPFPPGTGPARLLVMRHAEKTGDDGDPRLSSKGAERAQRLADYIPQTFGGIDFIFAARDSKKSMRPRETVEPLAKALGLEIDGRFDDEEPSRKSSGRWPKPLMLARPAPLMAALRTAGPDRALGAPDGSFPILAVKAVFDSIVEIVYGAGGPVGSRDQRAVLKGK